MVEHLGFEPFLRAPNAACYHYTRRSMLPRRSYKYPTLEHKASETAGLCRSRGASHGTAPHYRPTMSKGAPPQTERWLNESVSFGFLQRFKLPLPSDSVARLTGGVDYSGGAATPVLPRLSGIKTSAHT